MSNELNRRSSELDVRVRPSLRQIAAGLQSLARCFSDALGRPLAKHKHVRTLNCGGEATIEYSHFSNSALEKTYWLRDCGCESQEQEAQCNKELAAWVDTVYEKEAKHFRFKPEGSLVLELDESTALIFRPRLEVVE